MRILDATAVEALIDETTVLDSIRDLFTLPPGPGEIGFGRIDLAHPNGWLRSLPAFITSKDLLGFKVLHQTVGVGMRYTVFVHKLSTGELIGIVDALEVTNLRTGALSAVATDFLAPAEVDVGAIVGTGPVARGQLRALELVRPAPEIRVFARTPENRRAFLDDMADSVAGRLVEAQTLDDALEGAGLVTLATKAAQPVLLAEHLHAGIHVNSVGPASRDRIEVDPAIFESFDRVVCDSAEMVFAEAGDAHQAASVHGFDVGRAADLGQLVTGAVAGRTEAGEITLFKSVGNGAQDLMVAGRLLELAEEAGVGWVVEDVNSIKPVASGGSARAITPP
jgi:ornithine cyclodeaminase/alanine dehydrogenase-like protein (mu-crystallin family)